MEDNPQYYDQCVTEVRKCKILGAEMVVPQGPVSVFTFNDDPIAKILSREKEIGTEYDGITRTILIISN